MTLNELQRNIDDIEEQIAALPPGNISIKTIKGKAQPYLQWTENGKRISRYIKFEERDEVTSAIERKKRLMSLLQELKNLLPASEKSVWSLSSGKRHSGTYFNPGNSGFEQIIQGTYIDKTGLIEEINQRIGTTDSLVCISRPRRFGKSYAARMLCAYYDCSCDSHILFDDKKISETRDYEKYLNQFNVLYLDMTGFLSQARLEEKPMTDIPAMIEEAIWKDLAECGYDPAGSDSLSDFLIRCTEQLDGRKFVFIIDEWDAVIREAKDNPSAQKRYLDLLREWFKNGNFTPRVVAAAYMTGILPIKKDGSQSAISDFTEFPILYPDGFAEYTGFTEKEVQDLCDEYQMDFGDLKAWYDGYEFPQCAPVYNPYSVIRAIQNRKCRSYWQKTSAAESLMTYINMDFDGLQEIAARLITGEEIDVNVDTYGNDFETFRSKDDVLTLLIHLGYLAYNEDEKTVRIPNEEVRGEFRQILSGTGVNSRWIELIKKSRRLLADTVKGDGKAVAEAIASIRDSEYAPTFYNNEQALRYVVKFAYVAALDQYMKVEELPSGHGIADVVYIPGKRVYLPALLIELKWNRSSVGAIRQIKDKNYPAVLKGYRGDLILVGINYNEKTKEHTCEIETICSPS